MISTRLSPFASIKNPIWPRPFLPHKYHNTHNLSLSTQFYPRVKSKHTSYFEFFFFYYKQSWLILLQLNIVWDVKFMKKGILFWREIKWTMIGLWLTFPSFVVRWLIINLTMPFTWVASTLTSFLIFILASCFWKVPTTISNMSFSFIDERLYNAPPSPT